MNGVIRAGRPGGGAMPGDLPRKSANNNSLQPPKNRIRRQKQRFLWFLFGSKLQNNKNQLKTGLIRNNIL